MDSSSLDRATAINLCARCITLFLSPKNEAILKCSEGLVRQHAEKVMKTIIPESEYDNKEDSNYDNKELKTCPCCFNICAGDSLDKISASICADLTAKNIALERPVHLQIIVPPMLDTARITVRTIVCKSNEKTFVFPTMADLTSRLLSDILVRVGGLNIVGSTVASEIQITVTLIISKQTEFCEAMYYNYHHKKKKQRSWEPTSEDKFEVTRKDADSVLVSYKTLNEPGIALLQGSLSGYMNTHGAAGAWTVESIPGPLYLLGRYRKYARDVPQAPWTLGDERKGRNSVEEIISEGVLHALQGTGCKMHACGREDIDVRCLGNGRPFILEVSGVYVSPNNERLERVISLVASKNPLGLNKEGDVELLMLAKSTRSVWENMQTMAEEKRKAYRCVCWSSSPIDKEKLKAIEDLTRSKTSLDEEGRPCLKIIQKTPLRVLHRRSLLDRPRNIYNLSTALLNDHFFLLDITTSAGTYVKEFVHGDLGRTVPSIYSLLNCQADILQLDVVWLYDDFLGGGERPLKEQEDGIISMDRFSSSHRNIDIDDHKSNSSSDDNSNSNSDIKRRIGEEIVEKELQTEDSVKSRSVKSSFSWMELQNIKLMKQKISLEVLPKTDIEMITD